MQHETGLGHPECPERSRAIIDRVENSDLQSVLQWRRPDPADRSWLESNHDEGYVRYVEEACLSGRAGLDADTPISHDSYRVAQLAVGAALEAVDAVMMGECDNAFCATRPPGHHAEEAKAMGFCLFNNVAIAARYARRHYKLDRVLIFDWDVHHGNGTQASFYDDPQVFFSSVHQYPFYPGTGAEEERGAGKGRGTTLNFPVSQGTDGKKVREIMSGPLAEAVQQFKPELILLSAGFDAHREDPLGQLFLETEDYGAMTQQLRHLADETCDGRLVSLLEGGYNLKSLAESVEAHLRALTL